MTETVQTLEKKVYSPWAYTENESEKYKINMKIYEEIKDKAHCVGGHVGYAHHIKYMAIKDHDYFANLENPSASLGVKHELSNQLALIADGGNLCFGFENRGTLTNYTDWKGNKYDKVYVYKIYTD